MTTRKETYEPGDSSYDSTTLHEAGLNGDHSLVAAIIDSGMRLDSTDKYGDNALHLACRKAGAEMDSTDKWGNSVLHYIAASARSNAAKSAVEILFNFGRPNMEAVNNEGKTAMDIAAKNNDEALVKFLLKHS